MAVSGDVSPDQDAVVHFEVPLPAHDADGRWLGSDWSDLVTFRRSGVVVPRMVLVRHAGVDAALADAVHYNLLHVDGEDGDYYLIFRVRTILDVEVWGSLPWADLGAGDVFFAWDPYHALAHSREPGATGEMVYGGDWGDLQLMVDRHDPHPDGPRPLFAATDAMLQRAIDWDDAELVRRLLDRRRPRGTAETS